MDEFEVERGIKDNNQLKSSKSTAANPVSLFLVRNKASGEKRVVKKINFSRISDEAAKRI